MSISENTFVGQIPDIPAGATLSKIAYEAAREMHAEAELFRAAAKDGPSENVKARYGANIPEGYARMAARNDRLCEEIQAWSLLVSTRSEGNDEALTSPDVAENTFVGQLPNLPRDWTLFEMCQSAASHLAGQSFEHRRIFESGEPDPIRFPGMFIETHESTAKRMLLLAGAVQSWGAKVMVESEICHPPEQEE